MKKFGIVAAIVAGVCLQAGLSWGQQEIVFAISSDKGSLQQLTQEEFAKRANERLAGKAVVKVFHSSQLGKDKDLLQKLKLGSVHLSMPSSIMSSVVDLYGVWDMPFLIKDRAHVGRFVDKVFWAKLAPATEAKGYKVLGVWENGVRNITNNVRPINTPEDLKGLKIRVPGGVWRKKMFEAWGANPTPMAFSEVFVALQTKVVDGQENPNTNIYAAKFYEVQKHFTESNGRVIDYMVLVNAKWWKGLPADIRDGLSKAMAEATKANNASAEKLNEDARKRLPPPASPPSISSRRLSMRLG